MRVVLLVSLFIGSIYLQDVEIYPDYNALNCDDNSPRVEEYEYTDYWNHYDTCLGAPYHGYYNPLPTIVNYVQEIIPFSHEQVSVSDLTQDSDLNISDHVTLLNIILDS